MRSPFLVIMTTVEPMMRGLVGVAAVGWRLAVCERDGVVFLRFCASAAVPAQSEMTMRVTSDLIPKPLFAIQGVRDPQTEGQATSTGITRQHSRLPLH